MMTDDNGQIIKIDEPVQGIGKHLREAREGKKLSVEDVARQLNLSTDTVAKIESSEWSELHGRAYVRGYISNYAKLLDLPVDDLLISFNVEFGDDNSVNKPIFEQGNNVGPKAMLWFVILLILFALGYFGYPQWQKYQQGETELEQSLEDQENVSRMLRPGFVADKQTSIIVSTKRDSGTNFNLGTYS